MRVKDVMTTPAIVVPQGAPLAQALDLMIDHKLSGLAVVDEAGQLCGVLSESDMLRRVELGTTRKSRWWSRLFSDPAGAEAYRLAAGRKVCDLMTMSPITVDDTATLDEAAAQMEEYRVKRLPVLHDGDLVGMISRADFVKALRSYVRPAYEEQATSDEEIKTRILNEFRTQPWAADCFLDVSVSNGRVTLEGACARDGQRRAARVLAENVVGVQSVEGEIEVRDPVSFPIF